MPLTLSHILDPQALTREETDALARKYPAFTLPVLTAVATRTATPADMARLAVALPSITYLRDIVGDDADLLANFYPAEAPRTPSTMETIDTFLATYGTPADSRETDALTKAIFNPSPDYAALLAREEQQSAPSESELDEAVVGSQDAAINRFIASSKGRVQLPAADDAAEVQPADNKPSAADAEPDKAVAGTAPSPAGVQAADPGDLSESFARIMIKNGNYAKALEIISDLNLKNPEKSIYFADQIRFLRKLVAIDRANKNQQ